MDLDSLGPDWRLLELHFHLRLIIVVLIGELGALSDGQSRYILSAPSIEGFPKDTVV